MVNGLCICFRLNFQQAILKIQELIQENPFMETNIRAFIANHTELLEIMNRPRQVRTSYASGSNKKNTKKKQH